MTTDQAEETLDAPVPADIAIADVALPETDLPPCFTDAVATPTAPLDSVLTVTLSPAPIETPAPKYQIPAETGTYPISDSKDEIATALTVSAETQEHKTRTVRGGWTLGLLCIGLGIIACCVLLPAGDETRKLMYEREKLRGDLEHIETQVATNEEFLKKVETDPTLAERLAQRQMKLLPAGTAVLDIDASPTQTDSSPFLLVSVPAAAPLPPYQPRGGTIASLFRPGRSQLYLLGAGLMLCATGLVLGTSHARD